MENEAECVAKNEAISKAFGGRIRPPKQLWVSEPEDSHESVRRVRQAHR
jgi:hypothetical protein